MDLEPYKLECGCERRILAHNVVDESQCAAHARATIAWLASRTDEPCLCGMDEPGAFTRLDIVCPKHDGVFTVPG